MTKHDLQILDTLETAEYMKGELSDDGLRSEEMTLKFSDLALRT
jgi:hypothetical protein